MKFEELYNKIIKRDRKIHSLKTQNEKVTFALDEAKKQLDDLICQYEQCDQERQELLLHNQRNECRLKQA